MQDEELARQLVELGYRGSGEVSRRTALLNGTMLTCLATYQVIKREEFQLKKQAAAASKLLRRDQKRSGKFFSSILESFSVSLCSQKNICLHGFLLGIVCI